jgi:hypothetical protein
MEASLASAPSPNGSGSAPTHVTLGEHTYPVYAQRHAYLANRLGKTVAKLQEMEQMDTGSLEGVIGSLGDQAYDFLQVFIPKLMPRYEFAGYPTDEARIAGDYNEEYDKSPTIPEITFAFETALKANRLDSLKSLGKLINMDLVKAYLSAGMVNLIERQRSSSGEGTLDSTSSGTTPPTLTVSEV